MDVDAVAVDDRCSRAIAHPRGFFDLGDVGVVFDRQEVVFGSCQPRVFAGDNALFEGLDGAGRPCTCAAGILAKVEHAGVAASNEAVFFEQVGVE